MKKLSQINEGFLSKTINRSKTGEARIEDRIDSNISDLKEVDFGLSFVFADKDLLIDGKCIIKYDIIKEHLNGVFKSTGWRLPNMDELTDALNSVEIEYHTDHTGKNSFRTISGTCKKTGETLSFSDISPVYASPYLIDYEQDCDFDKNKSVRTWVIGSTDPETTPFGRFKIGPRTFPYRIRLIKDKK